MELKRIGIEQKEAMDSMSDFFKRPFVCIPRGISLIRMRSIIQQ